MMRTDLDHLPYAVQDELDHVQIILFEEFAEAIAGKQAPHRKAGRILKLILFGAFADPDWRTHDAEGGLTAFDILVIVNHDELAELNRYWRFAIARLDRAWRGGVIRRPVRLTLRSLAQINRVLTDGAPFFTRIAEESIMLYQSSAKPLAVPRRLPDAERHIRSGKAFQAWLSRGRGFLGGANYFHDAGNPAMAALLLHQACEHLYQCVLHTFTLHGRRTHALHELRDLAEQQDMRLRAAWPSATRFERRAFSCIRRAYVEARYGDHFRVSPQELEWAMDRVETLLNLVARACADFLDRLRPASRALVPARNLIDRAIALPLGFSAPARREKAPRYRWNRLIFEGWFRWRRERRWPVVAFHAMLALTLFTGGYDASAWLHLAPQAQFADAAVRRAVPADPSAILDFNIRAATVLEAVTDIADRSGYRLRSTDELWAIRWTGSYRAKTTTFDALADVLYGTGLCPAIRNDIISVRNCTEAGEDGGLNGGIRQLDDLLAH